MLRCFLASCGQACVHFFGFFPTKYDCEIVPLAGKIMRESKTLIWFTYHYRILSAKLASSGRGPRVPKHVPWAPRGLVTRMGRHGPDCRHYHIMCGDLDLCHVLRVARRLLGVASLLPGTAPGSLPLAGSAPPPDPASRVGFALVTEV